MGNGQFRVDSYKLEPAVLPAGFCYPHEFEAILERRLVDLEPWQILGGEALAARYNGLKQRYPGRVLVPFAARGDRDDVACWQVGDGEPIVSVVHDFASEERLVRHEYAALWDWLRSVIEDVIEYEGGERRR